MRAVFLDYDTVSSGDLDTASLERAMPDIEFRGMTADADIAQTIAAVEIVMMNKCRLTRTHFANARHLKLVAVAGTGTDNVDLTAAEEFGVGVCNVRAYCTQSVTQHVWALILALTQQLGGFSTLARNGSWMRNEEQTVLAYPIRELAGLTFGVIGWGALGKAAAKIAEAFAMHVIVATRPGAAAEPGRVDLDRLLASSDVVSLHCPLTAATRGLIGERELKLMKRGALLINTARGGLIDGRALAAALKSGRLGGAGIDVLPKEPPIDGDPLLDPDIPNLVLTPHVAWAAVEARQRCLDEMSANVLDYMSGGRRSRVV